MPEHDDDPTPEEIAASERLRDALEDPSKADPDADLARSLRAAFAPDPIEASAHAEIAAAALDASVEEIAAAAALRDALSGDELTRALRAAWSPTPLPDEEHRAIVDAALATMPAKVVSLTARRARLVRVSFTVVTGALALAASVFFVVRPDGGEAPLAKARSTQPLFSAPFKAGDASARIDRIALARASDYRDNRFTKWGVR